MRNIMVETERLLGTPEFVSDIANVGTEVCENIRTASPKLNELNETQDSVVKEAIAESFAQGYRFGTDSGLYNGMCIVKTLLTDRHKKVMVVRTFLASFVSLPVTGVLVAAFASKPYIVVIGVPLIITFCFYWADKLSYEVFPKVVSSVSKWLNKGRTK